MLSRSLDGFFSLNISVRIFFFAAADDRDTRFIVAPSSLDGQWIIAGFRARGILLRDFGEENILTKQLSPDSIF